MLRDFVKRFLERFAHRQLRRHLEHVFFVMTFSDVKAKRCGRLEIKPTRKSFASEFVGKKVLKFARKCGWVFVRTFMGSHVRTFDKSLTAILTGVRSDTAVNSLMHLQITPRRKGRRTFLARIRFLASVLSPVHNQAGALSKGFVAMLAFERFFTRMHAFV